MNQFSKFGIRDGFSLSSRLTKERFSLPRTHNGSLTTIILSERQISRSPWVGGAVKKGILKGEGAQKAHRHCIIQIRARAEPKKRLKGLDRPRALYHSRPLLLLQKLASFRHKLAEPKNANSMLIGCLEKCHTKVAKGQRGEDICTWQKEVKPYREKEKWFSKLACLALPMTVMKQMIANLRKDNDWWARIVCSCPRVVKSWRPVLSWQNGLQKIGRISTWPTRVCVRGHWTLSKPACFF